MLTVAADSVAFVNVDADAFNSLSTVAADVVAVINVAVVAVDCNFAVVAADPFDLRTAGIRMWRSISMPTSVSLCLQLSFCS